MIVIIDILLSKFCRSSKTFNFANKRRKFGKGIENYE